MPTACPDVTGPAIRAAVAANFQAPFISLSKLYEETHGETVLGIFGSSGLLSAQIQQGAPFDLFFSADSKRPQDLVTSGHAVGTAFTYARGRLALWVREGIREQAPGELPDQVVIPKNGTSGRFALANPELAPYGRAARDCLESFGLWKSSSKRAVYGNNVSQTYHFVASGGVTAGFIALSQAIAQNLPESELWIAPLSCHSPIEQQAVELRSANSGSVRRFLQFIAGIEAQSAIASLGYSSAPDPHP